MSIQDSTELRGIVRGKMIELESESGLPDGQAVKVTVHPVLAPGEGLRQSAGAWADIDDREFDEWLAETYRARKSWI
jgi:hypothetical protein